MTSEVVVMNRLGVALASDSAATVYFEKRDKVYHADKLFMLSNVAPVGAMVYNKSSLLGIPWETIFKMFRRHLGDRLLPRLEDYSIELIAFLNSSTILFPQDSQEHFFKNALASYAKNLWSEVEDERLNGTDEKLDTIRNLIQRELKVWREKGEATCFAKDKHPGRTMVGRLSGDIVATFKGAFDDIALRAEDMTGLFELARLMVDKDDIVPDLKSGLVVAGFGENDVLPVMDHYAVSDVYSDQVKYLHLEPRRVTHLEGAIVEPFAEREMVNCYLDGIAPKLRFEIGDQVSRLALTLTAAAAECAPKASRSFREQLRTQLWSEASRLVKLWGDTLNKEMKRNRTPIIRTIEFLPKDELAHVAASLVNLNSFQKRMSIEEDETVGGPIDVAVISKGDGFVWINRKHYFERDLNPHFFRNHGAVVPRTLERADDKIQATPDVDRRTRTRSRKTRGKPVR